MTGRHVLFGAVFATLSSLVFVACSGAAPPTPTPIPTPIPTPTPTLPLDVERLNVQVISSELSVGANRMVFALLDNDLKPILGVTAELSTFYPAESSLGEPQQKVPAHFRKWPLGDIGVYTAQLDFQQAGTWGLRVEATGSDGSALVGAVGFVVAEESSSPAIGAQAPRTKNKTSRDVDRLEELTSAVAPDPEFYSMTIEEALLTGRPLVVVFATPLFCRTATCGPQIEVIGDVKELYEDRVNFIHVEVFDNPHEIEGDLSKARTAPAVEEWGLVTEPWTFIVDSEGRIAAKFEAFTTEEELREHLDIVLE